MPNTRQRPPGQGLRANRINAHWHARRRTNSARLRHRLLTTVVSSPRACANIVAMTKRLFRAAIKTVAAIAAAVFFLARMTTSTGILWFVGAIIVLLVCFVLLRFLAEDDEDTGYWPSGPKT
jgi:beta-lactamase regulating signal transducer with metallopeptidase domain